MNKLKKFGLLHQDVQRWVWNQKWESLRNIQEQAIEPILNADCDVIIAASTSTGKTEAAFLPACSRIVKLSNHGIGILYISPLKALINDQYRRLESLGEVLDLQITPWHGDISNTIKEKQKKNPNGILLITPESLESLLLNQSIWCTQSFSNLSYIIIDEFHVFVGTERGSQLQSLMHRMEFLLKRIIPRIALSATLSQMDNIANYLRPNNKFPYKIIESKTSNSELKIQLRGYVSSLSKKIVDKSYYGEITKDLYKLLRGKSNLVFANSRKNTELISMALSELCEFNSVPNEFFTHHGSLSKEIRERLEKRLQVGKFPTTAVCTMTLELGIDIGNVDSIAQITAPYSVASLRQRLGRSGRRGEASVLRIFDIEKQMSDKISINDHLRLELFQCIAMVNLLLKKWYEPPETRQYHLSTLIQQTLSVIAQYGGVQANQLWSLLCKSGAFSLIDQSLYGKLLKVLGKHDLISQSNDGQLIIASGGEKLIGHYSFYTAFKTSVEYRLECDGLVLGTIPIDMPLMTGQQLIFSGKNWQIIHINSEKKIINLIHSNGGEPPQFSGAEQCIHNMVRQEMFNIYSQNKIPTYLDKQAKVFFDEGVKYFQTLGLGRKKIIQDGDILYIFPWMGDKIANTITILIRNEGVLANYIGGIISVRECNIDALSLIFKKILNKPKLIGSELSNFIDDTKIEKYDYLLSKELRNLHYGSKKFDINGAYNWIKNQVVNY